MLWGLRLRGQPGWEKNSLFGRSSLQTTLRAGHRVGLALSVLWGSPRRSRIREVAQHSPGWSCDQSLSEDANAFAAAQVQEQREPVRRPTTSLGQCHHQLPLTKVPTPPSSWCDAHFKKWGSVKGLRLYSLGNVPSPRHDSVRNRQTWSWWTRD